MPYDKLTEETSHAKVKAKTSFAPQAQMMFIKVISNDYHLMVTGLPTNLRFAPQILW